MASEAVIYKGIKAMFASRKPLDSPPRVPGGQPFNIAGMFRIRALLDAALRLDGARVRELLPSVEDLFAQQLRWGHQTRKLVNFQVEFFTPFNHSTYYYAPYLILLHFAILFEWERLVKLILDWFGSALAVAQRFECRGVVCLPCYRAKHPFATKVRNVSSADFTGLETDMVDGAPADEISQMKNEANQWWDGWIDDLLAWGRGGKAAKALAALKVDAALGPHRAEIMEAPFPLLYNPIHRADLGDGRYQAWFEPEEAPLGQGRTEDTPRFLGNRQILTTVRCSPAAPKDPDLWYFWAPAPPVPEDAKVEVLGLGLNRPSGPSSPDGEPVPAPRPPKPLDRPRRRQQPTARKAA